MRAPRIQRGGLVRVEHFRRDVQLTRILGRPRLLVQACCVRQSISVPLSVSRSRRPMPRDPHSRRAWAVRSRSTGAARRTCSTFAAFQNLIAQSISAHDARLDAERRSGFHIHLSPSATMPGAASGTKWLENDDARVLKEQPSRCSALRSTTVTRQPRSAHARAVLSPTTRCRRSRRDHSPWTLLRRCYLIPPAKGDRVRRRGACFRR